MKKRSVVLQGHRTSISLEDAFWTRLSDLARQDGLSINQLVASIDETRTGGLSSALRVYVLNRLTARPAPG